MDTVTVDAAALKEVLECFMTGQSHRILELQVLRDWPESSVKKLVGNYNDAVGRAIAAAYAKPPVSDEPEVHVMAVGQKVIPKWGHTLRYGAKQFDCAIVVSERPFVMISEDARLIWSTRQPDDFIPQGKVSDEQLARCVVCYNEYKRRSEFGPRGIEDHDANVD